MAFESLSSRLSTTLKKVSGQGRLTEANMEEMLSEIRLALLEADVNFQVVKEFIANTKELALGQDVLGSLKPGQLVVKIVNDELVKLLGTEVSTLSLNNNPNVIMMVGLQGSGKTTSTGKIANMLASKEAKRPLLVAADIYRPAAVDQLKVLGEQLNIPVFEKGTEYPAQQIVSEAMAFAKQYNHDVVMIDTAGRLHIDETLMNELRDIKEIAKPTDILLVVDALTGQDIVTVADGFNKALSLTGAVLTKLDGDSRGGGALSIRHITGVPIKFIGTGEKLDQLELFYPDRMATRILGMGDVVSLVEKVQDVYDEKDTMATFRRMQQGIFGLDDMLAQMQQVRKLGSLSGILKMMPGMANNMPQIDDEESDRKIKMTESIIYSMTPQERRTPDILTTSRKERIAKGCGKNIADVNRLIKQFEESKKMMKGLANMNPNTGMPGKSYNPNRPDPNRKKVRHKKKKK
ncbi:signal recognition particle protein [Tannockella kyphosi]|uniref:signal recognition particle protein n=1 Tax=Tannockella kyphosi TaxID=2899121 RepID=UPI002013512A|nr:signal recognition particle protein [Tannockella kyphosi]